jgi:NitT/TauT family transport system substrate-binding protein
MRKPYGPAYLLAPAGAMSPSTVARRLGRIGSGAVLAAVVLAACAGEPAARPAEPPSAAGAPAAAAKPAATGAPPVVAGAPRVPMRLSYPTTGATASVIWTATDGGFFERNGIDADVSYVESASTTLQALASGGLDVAQAGGTAPVNGALGGMDTVIIASLLNVLPYALMVDPAIRDGADLRGKRMGISRYGSSSDFAARYLLKHFSLRPEEDATLVQVGSQGARLAALKSGAVDGGMFELPFNVLISREGYRELITTADLLPYVHAAIFTTRGYVREHEAGMRQLARALVEAIAYMKQNREFTKQVMAKYSQEEDPAALDAAYDIYIGSRLAQVPYVSMDGLRSILEEVAMTNPEALKQDPAQLVDDRFVRELDTSAFVASLYR